MKTYYIKAKDNESCVETEEAIDELAKWHNMWQTLRNGSFVLAVAIILLTWNAPDVNLGLTALGLTLSGLTFAAFMYICVVKGARILQEHQDEAHGGFHE